MTKVTQHNYDTEAERYNFGGQHSLLAGASGLQAKSQEVGKCEGYVVRERYHDYCQAQKVFTVTCST